MSRHVPLEHLTMHDREVIRREVEAAFHGGTLAALDVIFLADQPTLAEEIVNATDADALLRHARSDSYHNLPALIRVIRELRRREVGRNRTTPAVTADKGEK
jgi:hypothetical protein